MSVPALRFKEFSGDWEEKALGEIADIKRGASPRPISDKKWFSGESKVGWVRISDVTRSSKYLTNTEQYLSREGISKSRLVKQGNIIMSICATIGKPIYTTFDVCIHDGFVVFENLQISHDYLFYYLILIEKKWYQYGQPGSQVNLNSDIVSNEKISIPSLPEQSKIANFLTAVDKKISLLTQKASLLSQYKKGVMQQIFSQELRFKDDDGQVFPEWEEKTLGEVGENIIGLTYSPKNVTDDKSCPIVLRSSNIKNDMLDLNDQVRVKENIPEKLFTKKDDILICTRNGSQRLIGKNVLISNVETQMTFGAFMSVYRSPFNRFIVHLFKTDNYNEQIQMNLGARINSITTKNLNAFSFWFPSLPEQTKIANFLTAIDEKITTNQNQLNAVKQYKQGLLQQMFV